MLKRIFLPVLAAIALSVHAGDTPDSNLEVVIIRHGEKPDHGENLSCQGEHRALQLPAVLEQKFKTPNHIYVPKLSTGEKTKHSRMFQTAIPLAVKLNLTINTNYADDNMQVAQDVLKQTGTILMVWNHSQIPSLVGALGVKDPPTWTDKDFDGIWVITFPKGKASLAFDQEGLTPSATCEF